MLKSYRTTAVLTLLTIQTLLSNSYALNTERYLSLLENASISNDCMESSDEKGCFPLSEAEIIFREKAVIILIEEAREHINSFLIGPDKIREEAVLFSTDRLDLEGKPLEKFDAIAKSLNDRADLLEKSIKSDLEKINSTSLLQLLEQLSKNEEGPKVKQILLEYRAELIIIQEIIDVNYGKEHYGSSFNFNGNNESYFSLGQAGHQRTGGLTIGGKGYVNRSHLSHISTSIYDLINIEQRDFHCESIESFNLTPEFALWLVGKRSGHELQVKCNTINMLQYHLIQNVYKLAKKDSYCPSYSAKDHTLNLYNYDHKEGRRTLFTCNGGLASMFSSRNHIKDILSNAFDNYPYISGGARTHN